MNGWHSPHAHHWSAQQYAPPQYAPQYYGPPVQWGPPRPYVGAADDAQPVGPGSADMVAVGALVGLLVGILIGRSL